MSLRLRFTLYLVISHLLFGIAGVYLMMNRSFWLLTFEAAFVISLATGLKLVSNLIGKIELINSGSQFIHDGDFTSRFIEVGQSEVDRLVRIYNSMIDHLREERTRLEEQNLLLEKLMAASPAGILIMDFDGRITQTNPSARAILQLEHSEMEGKTLVEMAHPILDEAEKLNTGQSHVLPISGLRRVMLQKSEFLDRGFSRSFLIIEELTEEIRKSEKAAYERLIRLMSHEVNNTVGAAGSLLHSCLNYSSQIREADRGDFENAINVVIQRTTQLGRFMRSFADIVKLPKPVKEPTNVLQLLEGIVSLFRAECLDRNITVSWETSAMKPIVDLDRVQMEQVFLNIVKNAIEAIDKDGVITIRCNEDMVIIEDTGTGIDPEAGKHLFTPFFSTKEFGQGIGLTLVREVLESHKFDFSLTCEPERTTRFRIQFLAPGSSGGNSFID